MIFHMPLSSYWHAIVMVAYPAFLLTPYFVDQISGYNNLRLSGYKKLLILALNSRNDNSIKNIIYCTATAKVVDRLI